MFTTLFRICEVPTSPERLGNLDIRYGALTVSPIVGFATGTGQERTCLLHSILFLSFLRLELSPKELGLPQYLFLPVHDRRRNGTSTAFYPKFGNKYQKTQNILNTLLSARTSNLGLQNLRENLDKESFGSIPCIQYVLRTLLHVDERVALCSLCMADTWLSGTGKS